MHQFRCDVHTHKTDKNRVATSKISAR